VAYLFMREARKPCRICNWSRSGRRWTAKPLICSTGYRACSPGYWRQIIRAPRHSAPGNNMLPPFKPVPIWDSSAPDWDWSRDVASMSDQQHDQEHLRSHVRWKGKTWPFRGTKNSTLAEQRPAFTDFAQLRLARSTTLLSANCTCAKLRTISLGLQRFQATHKTFCPRFESVWAYHLQSRALRGFCRFCRVLNGARVTWIAITTTRQATARNAFLFR